MPDPKKFHLAWFTNFAATEWDEPFAADRTPPWDGEFYCEFARTLERACFDYIMLEDTLMLSEAYGGTTAHYLRRGLQVPKHDPVPLCPLMAQATTHIGTVATMSTLGYTPFLLARLSSTVDHLTGGRFGWNIVTSGEDAAAQNFGLDRLTEHDVRYEMADEFMECVNQLFDSWEPDAVIMDPETGTYVHPDKVRPIHFKGKYFSSRGPLNTAPSPQIRPTYVQAGGSPRGRDFAAKHADSIIAVANGPKAMKAFRDDIRQRAAGFGRNPDDVKVFYLFAPILGETEEEAIARRDRAQATQKNIDFALGLYSGITDIDLGAFDLDKPLPELTTNGESTSLAKFAQWGSGKTLRQCILEGGAGTSVQAVGTPEQVADIMIETMAEVGGDGFLVKHPFYLISRRYILEVCEGLVPALQKRGAVRTEYTGTTLRETLREF